MASTTASVSARKRQSQGGETSSSGPEVIKITGPKKVRRKKSSRGKGSDTQDSSGGGHGHGRRDALGRFAVDPLESKRDVKRLEEFRTVEDGVPDRGVQLPTKRRNKSMALKKKMVEAMADHPTDDLTAVVGKDTETVEMLAYSANNLKGTTQKAFYEAAARISAAAHILGSRVQTMSGGDALEELRGEVEALRKANAELRADLKAATTDINALRERNTAQMQDFSRRITRETARKRMIQSDTEDDATDMQVDEMEEGEATGGGGGIFSLAPYLLPPRGFWNLCSGPH